MKIQFTNVSDIDLDNIDKEKINLLDKIIEYVYPLFDDLYNNKINDVEILENKLSKIKKNVNNSKNELEKLLQEYNDKKKRRKLCDTISKLVRCGIVNDSSLKSEMIILLKVVDNLSPQKVDYHISEISKIIKKRFRR